MRSFIQRCALLSGIAVLVLASPLAFAATTGGFDTPSGVQTMPIAVEGNAILTLTDAPSNAVVVDGRLQLSGWFGIGTTTPVSPLDIVIPYYPSTPAIHTYAPSVFGNIWIGGTNDFSFDGGSDSAFWFHNTGAASGATAFLWNGQFNLYISNTGYVGIGTTAPQARLDVNGEVRVGNSGAQCTSNNAGAIRWTGTGFQGCNGSNWGPIGFSQTTVVHAAANSTCGERPALEPASIATCPAGYQLVGGGYSLDTWNPASNPEGSNSPDSSMPDGNNGWYVWAGGLPAYSCFSAYAICAK